MGELNSQNITINPYLQNLSASSNYVMWETDGWGRGEVIYGLRPNALNKTTISVNSKTDDFHYMHKAYLTSLKPNRTYFYRVVMKEGEMSELYNFRTLDKIKEEQSTQIVILSDPEQDPRISSIFQEIIEDGIIPKIEDEVSLNKTGLEAILFTGDFINPDFDNNQWRSHFFKSAEALFPYIPFYGVPGENENFYDSLLTFQRYLQAPKNGPRELENQVWYKDISNVRIIGFDTNVDKADKAATLEWLDQLLEESCSYESIDFILALFHHPAKSEFEETITNELSMNLVNRMETFSNRCEKLSLHTFGKSHAYGRGFSKNAGHLWLNTGTAGGPLEASDNFERKDVDEFVKSTNDYGFTLLNFTAGDDPSLSIKRFSRGNKKTGLRNSITDEFDLLLFAAAPESPVTIYPKQDTLINQCITFKSSSFVDPNHQHQASQWQIALSNNFKDSLVEDIWIQSENFYKNKDLNKGIDLTKVEINSIAPNKAYNWRVRYRNQHLKWSDWSESGSFYLKDLSKNLSTNLLLNGDGEGDSIIWKGDIESLKYGRCNTGRAYEGKYHFVVGGVCFNQLDTGYAYQDIPLQNFKDGIQKYNYAAELSGYMRNFNGADIAQMYLEFYQDSTLISRTKVLEQRSQYWENFTGIYNIPKLATVCRVVLKGIRNYGKSNDAYFDLMTLKIIEPPKCFVCIGTSNVDNDGDGFCNDKDCDDSDPLSYPGAVERCDQKDNDCNGFGDNGITVSWTGLGSDNLWTNKNNWNQNSIPLPCQEVIFNSKDSIFIDANVACKKINLGKKNVLLLKPNGTLNFTAAAAEQAADIKGTFLLNGKCHLSTNAKDAFYVSGKLLVNGIVITQDVFDEQVVVKKGGTFKSKYGDQGEM